MQVRTYFCRQGLRRPSCFAVIYTGNRRLTESRIVAQRMHEACMCRSLQMSHTSHITRLFQAFIRHLHGSFAWRGGNPAPAGSREHVETVQSFAVGRACNRAFNDILHLGRRSTLLLGARTLAETGSDGILR